ncbi:ATP-dependent DNA helicase 2 subunit KU80 [Capsicum chinense]|nr:ATP-dependent DNA helicase 2 subunit KU80 [Capsicum chinense]
MKKMNKVAIVQCIVDILLDHCLQPDLFYFNGLPFAEDVREFHFSSFSYLPSSVHPNEKQQEAADKLVQMLYLAPPGIQKVLPPDFTPNLVLEVWRHDSYRVLLSFPFSWSITLHGMEPRISIE